MVACLPILAGSNKSLSNLGTLRVTWQSQSKDNPEYKLN